MIIFLFYVIKTVDRRTDRQLTDRRLIDGPTVDGRKAIDRRKAVDRQTVDGQTGVRTDRLTDWRTDGPKNGLMG